MSLTTSPRVPPAFCHAREADASRGTVDAAEPAAVRYGWADHPEGGNLYMCAGLPAAPFRTDDWPLNR